MNKLSRQIIWLTAVSLLFSACKLGTELGTPEVETAVFATPSPSPEPAPTETATIRGTETAVFPSTAVPITFTDIQTYSVKPSLTDAAISQRPGEHLAYYNATIPAQNQLVVILPGTGATPDLYSQFSTVAAGLGFHTVGLVYENRGSISSLCKQDDDENCAEQARLEIINGTDLSAKVNVNQPNSIENRLLRLLQYLHEQHPDEGWNQYFQEDAIIWERLIITGHSQGGGHAGLLARDHAVARVIFFNSPSDFNATFGTTASWIKDEHVTPSENYYAFFHWEDGGARRVQVYEDFGMASFGAPANVDDDQQHFAGSHMLYTKNPSSNPHVAVVGDPFLPLDAQGVPLYQDVWAYLLTP